MIALSQCLEQQVGQHAEPDNGEARGKPFMAGEQNGDRQPSKDAYDEPPSGLQTFRNPADGQG